MQLFPIAYQSLLFRSFHCRCAGLVPYVELSDVWSVEKQAVVAAALKWPAISPPDHNAQKEADASAGSLRRYVNHHSHSCQVMNFPADN